MYAIFGLDICKWPPYASRISFELYQRKRKQNSSQLQERRHLTSTEEPQHNEISGVERNSNENQEETSGSNDDIMRNSFVRVIFNGYDVTKYIPACLTNYCPLDAFERQIKSLLGSNLEFQKACAI